MPQAKRRGDRAHAEDDRRIPRRHAEHDAHWLPDGQRQNVGLVGGDDVAGDLRCQRRRLPQDAGTEMHVEAGPGRGGTRLLQHRAGEIGRPRLQEVGGLEQQRPSQAGPGLGPGREGRRGRRNDLRDIFEAPPPPRGWRLRPSPGRGARRFVPSYAAAAAPSMMKPISMAISPPVLSESDQKALRNPSPRP